MIPVATQASRDTTLPTPSAVGGASGWRGWEAMCHPTASFTVSSGQSAEEDRPPTACAQPPDHLAFGAGKFVFRVDCKPAARRPGFPTSGHWRWPHPSSCLSHLLRCSSFQGDRVGRDFHLAPFVGGDCHRHSLVCSEVSSSIVLRAGVGVGRRGQGMGDSHRPWEVSSVGRLLGRRASPGVGDLQGAEHRGVQAWFSRLTPPLPRSPDSCPACQPGRGCKGQL